jgi:ComF family protein
VLGLLFPSRCLACGRPGSELCAFCRERLPRLEGPVCARCGAPVAWPVERCRECAGRRLAFVRARAALAYTGAVPRLILSWKERGLRKLTGEAAALVAELLPRPEVRALVPVPAQGERLLRRGFYPAGALAGELARRWELPMLELLERTGPPRRQRGLPLAERRQNVTRAFRSRDRAPLSVCLIDDVYTSGATVLACAGALRRAGARRVEVITLARAVRDR